MLSLPKVEFVGDDKGQQLARESKPLADENKTTSGTAHKIPDLPNGHQVEALAKVITAVSPNEGQLTTANALVILDLPDEDQI